MRRGDIYIVSLDPTKGHEQSGSRRVLIVSSDEFNRVTGLPVVVPITQGGNFSRVQGYTVSLMGLPISTQGVVLCSQPRVLDLKSRNGRFLNERLPDAILDDVLARLATLFE
jgi:mRNA-degrading endonuclease toxin of MazEF toxin-antitoxin module